MKWIICPLIHDAAVEVWSKNITISMLKMEFEYVVDLMVANSVSMC